MPLVDLVAERIPEEGEGRPAELQPEPDWLVAVSVVYVVRLGLLNTLVVPHVTLWTEKKDFTARA